MSKREIDGIIRKWLDGDERAFRQISNHYYRQLIAPSLKMVQNREDAEELVMNVLLKVWMHKHHMSEALQFDDYLFGILRRETAILSRKQVLETENIDDLAYHELGSADHPEITLKELQDMYKAALDKLTPKQRAVFISLRENEMSRKELAEKTGMSLNTINSHMKSANKILKQELAEYYGLVLVSALINPSVILIA